MTGPRRDTSGFTLIELLVSITILGVIVVPLTSAVISMLQTQAAETRLSESHDEQIASIYGARDIASAEAFTPTGCATSGTVVLSLDWHEPDPTVLSTPTSSPVNVDYALDSTSPKRLVRTLCVGGGNSSVVLAHNVATATCVDAAGAPISGGCPTGAAAAGNVEVRLLVTETSGRSFVIQGKRRAT